MNPIRIPNLSDENSIMITAEFFEDGHRLRLDRTRIHRYELDLIVPDDITLDELLNAIHDGICTQLSQRYNLEDPETNPAYLETIQQFAQMNAYAATLPREFFRERKLRKPLHFRHHAAISAMDRYNAESALPEPAPEEEDMWRWMVCLKVYQLCREQYQKGYPEPLGNTMRVAFRQKAYPKHPVIACGSISSRKWSDDTLRSLAKHTQIWLQQGLHGDKTLRELGFLSSSRLIFDPNSHHSATPWFDALELQVPQSEMFPLYNTGKRQEVQPVSSKIRIDAPHSLRHTPVPTVFFACGALLVSAAAFLPGAFLSQQLKPLAGSLADVLLYCFALLALTAGWCSYRKLCSMQQRQWYRHYEDYIRNILQRLKTIQLEDIEFLSQRYPPVYDLEDRNDLLERTFHLDGSISGRRKDQRDFLHVRIGLSKEDSRTAHSLAEFQLPEHNEQFSAIRYKNIRGIGALPFQIIAPSESEEALASNDGTVGFLNCLAEDIQDTYAWLDHAPVLMDLHHPRAVGVYIQDASSSSYPLLNNVIFDLCYHHAPDDLQLILFCPTLSGLRQRQEFIRQFKQLPHFNGLLPDQSQFVFDAHYASQIMDRIRQIHTANQSCRNAPHIIMMVLEDHGFRRHPLSDLLPTCVEEMEPKGNDITFLFFSHTESALPPYCSYTFKIDNSRNCYLIPYVHRFEPGERRRDPGIDARYGITPDSFASCFLIPGKASDDDRMYQGFKILSSLRRQGTHRSNLPRRLTLSQLIRQSHPEFAPSLSKDFTEKQWVLGRKRCDLRFPIGVDTHGSTWLDMERLGHVLVASGACMIRSESVGAMLQSLCCHYSPQSAQIFLIGPQPDDICACVEHQSHIALSLSSSSSGDFVGTVMQLFQNLRKEASRRAAEFELLQVSNLRSYNRTLQKPIPQSQAGMVKTPNLVPRLIVVIDHLEQFAEQGILQELNWLLKNGADYGIHILLSAEHPDRFLPAELWSCFRGRLCLKTENPHLSKWMLHSDAACNPDMPGGGRCYLYDLLTGELIYTQLVQLSGAVPFRITLAEPNRYSLLFYDSTDSEYGSSGNFVPEYMPPERESETKYEDSRQNEAESNESAARGDDRVHTTPMHVDIPNDQYSRTPKYPPKIPDDQINCAIHRT